MQIVCSSTRQPVTGPHPLLDFSVSIFIMASLWESICEHCGSGQGDLGVPRCVFLAHRGHAAHTGHVPGRSAASRGPESRTSVTNHSLEEEGLGQGGERPEPNIYRASTACQALHHQLHRWLSLTPPMQAKAELSPFYRSGD